MITTSGGILVPEGETGVRARYGDIKVSRIDGKLQVVLPHHWERDNLVLAKNLPGFVDLEGKSRPLYVHKYIEQPLRAALTGATARRSDYKILTLGCWNVRMSRTTAKLSTHSWAIAVDLNADKNPLVRLAHTTDTFASDIPNEWIEEFERCGFLWGGKFQGLTRDPMHFQLARAY
ncbi:MAG: hypothetical protein UY96_C0003G0050 [Parcubacteria group bacterium GW2011_GWB1_56_8]|nr:MAG: hypothetical protein UY96_C0003G0050 [Parcubacteria group bacterium GW2011_GWB1_56_8]